MAISKAKRSAAAKKAARTRKRNAAAKKAKRAAAARRRKKHLREKQLRDEEDNQSFALKHLFLFFLILTNDSCTTVLITNISKLEFRNIVYVTPNALFPVVHANFR